MVRKVRTTKVRNEWTILIMNKLLKNTSMYQFSKDIPSFSSLYPVIPDHAKSQKDDAYSFFGVIKNEEHGKGNHLIQP